MIIKNKNGELTTQQMVMLIILITSFSIILFLLFRLNLGKETEREICHNSVLMKGVLPKDTFSLNCHRQYVCITSNGTCEGLTKPEIVKVKTLEEVYERLANEMADCWWMFGEGKVDYTKTKATKKNYCSICSQILFDDSLKDVEGIDETISKDELYNYLANQKISNKEITYSEYLFGTKDINELKKQSIEATGQEGEGTFGNIEISKHYFVLMGITNEVGNIWKVLGGIGIGAGVFAGIVTGSWVVGAIVVAGSVITGVGGEIISEVEPEILALTIEGDGIDNQFMAPTIQEVDSEKFKSLNCEEILTSA